MATWQSRMADRAPRPHLELLDGRLQPGSMLAAELGTSVLADVLGVHLGRVSLGDVRPLVGLKVAHTPDAGTAELGDAGAGVVGTIPKSESRVKDAALAQPEVPALADIVGHGPPQSGRLPMTIGGHVGDPARPGGDIGSKGPNLLFYGGDTNEAGGLANEYHSLVRDARVYDDVRIRGEWTIDCLLSRNLMTFTGVIQANAEIRGPGQMSEGNGLTQAKYAPGASATQKLTGFSAFGYLEYEVKACGLGFGSLPQGHYYINVQPIGFGSGRSFQSDTDGAKGKGSPLANDNTWFDSLYFGYDFTDVATVYGIGTWDFTAGICSAPAC
jgi:hypothetical protein